MLCICFPATLVMPLVLLQFWWDGHSAGAGHLARYLTHAQPSSSAVTKIGRVVLGCLLGLLYLCPVRTEGRGQGVDEELEAILCMEKQTDRSCALTLTLQPQLIALSVCYQLT